MTANGRFARLQVGAESFIGRAELALHDSLTIGACVCINDGVRIFTASHDLQSSSWRQITAPVTILDFAWIASDATILPGVTIGKGAVVGACAVVSKDVPDFALAVGNPAIIKSERRVRDLSYSPARFLAFQNAWLD